MGEKESGERTGMVTVLPSRPEVALYPNAESLPQGFLGIPLLARMRYASEEKQFDAFQQLVAAKNRLMRELLEQRRLMDIYVGQSERMRHLDDIRETARLGVRTELARAQYQYEDANHALEHQRLRGQVGKAHLEFELVQITRERERLERDPGDAKAEPDLADQFASVAKEIEEIEAAYAAECAKSTEKAGGAEDLQDRLRMFETLKQAFIQRVTGALL